MLSDGAQYTTGKIITTIIIHNIHVFKEGPVINFGHFQGYISRLFSDFICN